jgi:4-diphosphocytidyl-2-C-methyl-D-erythritol kinase
VNCPAKENLITKAREKLEDFIGKSIKCRVNLFKNIPESAGLGGGSSDAASALICFNKLYKLNLGLHQLCKIGMQVGKDVPFFIYNIGTALVKGTGEKIKVSNRKPSNFYVLAKPCESINTRTMYSLFDKKAKSFFELAQKICPSVKKLYSYFFSISKECGMTGTGPTIFAGFDSYEEALKAKNNFRDRRFKGDFYICRPSKKTYEIIF